MDWIHCNSCYIHPSINHPTTFCISSCGHLFCANCLNKKDNYSSGIPSTDLCHVCKKKCSYLEVNRTLKAELQMLFRHPRELLTQYMKNLKSVIEFQTFHRSHFQKHLTDKVYKASKCVKQAQSEISKRIEHEKTLNIECQQLKSDLEKHADLIRSLEKVIAEKDKELIQFRQKTITNSMRQSKQNKAKPNLNSNTPINTLSFIHCATSTPICNMQIFDGIETENSGGKRKNIFTANSGEFDTPIDGILGGSPAVKILNTPAMLGIGQSYKNKKHCGNQVEHFF